MPTRHTALAAWLLAALAFEATAQNVQPTATSVPFGTMDPAMSQDPLRNQAMWARAYYTMPSHYPGYEGLLSAARFQSGGFAANGLRLNHGFGGSYVPRARDASYDPSYMPPAYQGFIGPQDAPGRLSLQLPGLVGAGLGVLAGFHLGGGIGGILGGVLGYVAGHAFKKMLNPHQEFSLLDGGFIDDPDPYNQVMGGFRGRGGSRSHGSQTSGSTLPAADPPGFIDADAELPGSPGSDLDGLRSQYEEAFQRYVEALENGRDVAARQQEYEAANARYQKALGR